MTLLDCLILSCLRVSFTRHSLIGLVFCPLVFCPLVLSLLVFWLETVFFLKEPPINYEICFRNFNPFHPEAKELVLNSENNVERWLKLLKMEQHLDKFRERDLSNLTQLTKVSYNQLKNDFGIQLVGNIRKLIQSIEVIRELQNDQSSSSANQESASINNNNTRQSLALIDQSLNNWCFSPNGVETFTGTTEI